MLFVFVNWNTCTAQLSVSARHGSEIKQLSVAIGMTRKQSYYLWPRSRHRMVACSCQAAFKNLVSHSKRVWLRCSRIVINIYCRITEEHGGKTVENLYHAGVRQHCRKLMELQKAIPVSHAAWSCAKCMHSCLSGIRRVALPFSRIPWNYMWPCRSQMREQHRCYCKMDNGRGKAYRLNSPLVAPLDVCMHVRYWPTKYQETKPPLPSLPEKKQITCSGVKLALAWRLEGTHSLSITFHVVEHVTVRASPEISWRRLRGRASPVKDHWSSASCPTTCGAMTQIAVCRTC